jgi:MOSC domain-containing protein YiiM
MTGHGMLSAIWTSPVGSEPLRSHESINVLANGLEDDRYATGKGFYSGMSEWDAHVTLIAQEPFDALATEQGVHLDPKELRRNLITRDVDLLSLIGKRFRIGDQVVLYGRKLWPPCKHIVELSGRPEIFKLRIAKKCGIGADVLVGGQIKVGDAIVVEGP